MGKCVLLNRKEAGGGSSTEDIESFAAAFDVELDDDVIEKDVIDFEFFYLWDTNEAILEIYKIVRNYLDESYNLNRCSNIIIELAKEYSTKVSYVLENIIYVHYGYLNMIIDDSKAET